MALSKTVVGFLQQYQIPYTVVHHPRSFSMRETARAAQVPPEQIAKAVILTDRQSYVMAVVPGDKHVELNKLSEKLGRRLELAQEYRTAPVFRDCELGAIPPIGPAYGMETVVDDGLVGQEEICFVGGDHEELVCVDGDQFLRLLKEARHARFSH